jgi:hypothetical protein
MERYRLENLEIAAEIARALHIEIGQYSPRSQAANT